MDKKEALLKIEKLLEVYNDENWDFIPSYFTNMEIVQIEMIKRKTFGDKY